MIRALLSRLLNRLLDRLGDQRKGATLENLLWMKDEEFVRFIRG